MTSRWILVGLGAAPLALALVLTGPARAEDNVRYYEKGGVTYRETRRVVHQPVSETHYEDRDRTVYRHQLTTEHQPTQRTYLSPVTEYQLEPYWINRFNPFVDPVQAYRYVPHTRWEARVETVHVPVTRSEWVAEKRTYQVPVTDRRMVEKEVIERVAVGGATGSSNLARLPDHPSLARTERVGGISRLDNEPPRSGSVGWEAGEGTVRR